MKNGIKVALTIILMTAILLGWTYAMVETKSGKCGENASWTLDDDGMLIISGNDEMWDYTEGSVPWKSAKHAVIENGITCIGKHAFDTCQNLESIEIPESVKQIKWYAFFGCFKLEQIIIPNGVELVDVGAFSCCHKLSDVTIPDSVTQIGNAAFYGCTGLKNIYLPSEITTIGSGVFDGCDDLIIHMDENDFYALHNGLFIDKVNKKVLRCQSIDDSGIVEIPEYIKSIEPYSFANKVGVKKVLLPEGVVSIGEYAFKDCSGLTEIVIPESVETIRRGAFSGCTNLRVANIPNAVTNIAGVFTNCKSLTQITIPTGVINIESAFSGCTNLTSVIIPEKIEKIGEAFSDCTNLVSVAIPEGVYEINMRDFANCTSLENINIPDSVGKLELLNCRSIKNLSLPENLTNLLLSGCDSLSEITIPKSVNKLIISRCNTLSKIDIPEGVIELNIINCNNISNLEIPESVEVLFLQGCDGIIETIIPSNVKMLSLKGCSNLTEIVLPQFAEMETEAFKDCISLKSIVIPSSMNQIKKATFTNCKSLSSIIIPDGITNIEGEAFSNCDKIKCIELASSVTKIGTSAFAGCDNLKYIYFTGDQKSRKAISISGDNDLLKNAEWHYNESMPDDETKIGFDLTYSWDEKTKKVTATATCKNDKKHVITETRKAELVSTTPATVEKEGKLIYKVSFKDQHFEEQEQEFSIPRLIEITVDGSVYSVDHEKKTAMMVGVEETDVTTFTIPATIKVGKAKYKVTEVKAQACKSLKKVEKLNIGKNVSKIGAKAFYYCKTLKEIKIDGTSLKSIGDQAFKGVPKTVTVKCPKKKLADYKKMMIDAGVPKNAKFTK